MFRILATVLLALELTAGSPIAGKDDTVVADCKDGPTTDVYDQRQNGTDNYRINVKGVVVLIAPADSMATSDVLTEINSEDSDLKPPPEVEPAVDASTPGSPSSTTNSPAKKRSKVKVLNLLKLLRQYKALSIN